MNKDGKRDIFVLIMAAHGQPSERNVQAIKDTYVSFYKEHRDRLKHAYSFYFYDGGNQKASIESDGDCTYTIHTTAPDDINHTYEKTIAAMNEIVRMGDNDSYLVRLNISTYFNIGLFDSVVDGFRKNAVYANKFNVFLNNWHYLNDCSPRGDAYVMPWPLFRKVVSGAKRFPETKVIGDNVHVDDMLMGCVLIDILGNDYVDNYWALKYAYMPYSYEEFSKKVNECIDVIFTRCKTVPVGKVSGWSWNDSFERRDDPYKMECLNDRLKETFDQNMERWKTVKEDYILANPNDLTLSAYDIMSNTVCNITFDRLKTLIKVKRGYDVIY